MAMSELKQKLLLFELNRLGFPSATYDPMCDRVKVKTGPRSPVLISDNGEIFYARDDRELVRDTVRPAVAKVNEAAAAWENARSLTDMDLPAFRVMAEYNNTVLAARNDTGAGYGFHYVTWKYNYERTGMQHGHYSEDFAAAKENFALRAGLVPESKILMPEQAAVVREAVAYRLGNDCDILPAAAEALEAVASKLDTAYPAPAVREHDAPGREMDGPEMQLDM
jgi:hypothetical protein